MVKNQMAFRGKLEVGILVMVRILNFNPRGREGNDKPELDRLYFHFSPLASKVS
jgi:hypothetical protein